MEIGALHLGSVSARKLTQKVLLIDNVALEDENGWKNGTGINAKALSKIMLIM
jgi:hypothetical protein